MLRLRTSTGQSIVFMAILILVLLIFAGLSIDTGNAYGRQRTIQAAANASSVAGMNAVILRESDTFINKIISNTLGLNGVRRIQKLDFDANWGTDTEVLYYKATYIDKDGLNIPVGSLGSSKPFSSNVVNVHIETSTNVDTFFSQVAGLDDLTVGASGYAGIVPCETNVFPIAFDQKWIPTKKLADPNEDTAVAVTRLESLIKLNYSYAPPTVSGTKTFQWIRWRANDLVADALVGSGSFVSGFQESPPPPGASTGPNQANGKLDFEDWLSPNSDVSVASVQTQLNYLKDNKVIMLIPAYSAANVNTGRYVSFQHQRLIKVRLLAITGNELTFGYVDDVAVCGGSVSSPPECITLPCVPEYNYAVQLDEQLVWYIPSTTITNYDISMVFDISSSMQFCYTTNNSSCPQADQRWSYISPVLTSFVQKMLVEWNAPITTPGGKNGDNRLGLIEFSSAARQKVQFSTLATVEARTLEMKNAFTTYIAGLTYSYYNGSTNGARGFDQGLALFDRAPRSVDRFNKPIKHIIVLITDGLTNGMYAGPQAGMQNQYFVRHSSTSAPGGTRTCAYKDNPLTPANEAILPITDDPAVQYTCPEGPSKGEAKAPLLAMEEIAIAAQSRALKPVTFYAVVLSNLNLGTPQDTLRQLRMDSIAPGHAYYADQPNELLQMVNAIGAELGTPCYTRTRTRPADGAKVSIFNEAGQPVHVNVPTNAEGKILVELAPGNYSLSANHSVATLPIITGDPPFNAANYPAGYLPQLYNQLTEERTSSVVPSVTFTMPETNFTGPDLTLSIAKAEVGKGKCPR